jgi:ABC-type siderophore export system fused ATPase/permease subunit
MILQIIAKISNDIFLFEQILQGDAYRTNQKTNYHLQQLLYQMQMNHNSIIQIKVWFYDSHVQY